MITGKKITIGGREFIVPPANFGALIRFDEVKKKSTPGDLDHTQGVLDFIHATLRRNYPDLDRDFILEHVDMRNMNAIFNAIAEAAGMEEGEAQAGN